MKSNNGVILIVDDLPENVMVVEKTLQKEGYRTEIATTGAEALDRLKANQPDLVLLDVLMPKVDGFEVCRQIKADEDLAHIPIIFLTALNEPKYIIQGFNAGGVDFISKPFNLTELLARVKTHVDLKKAQEENRRYIEQMKKTNEQLSKAKNMLTELNNNKDKFFSIIAHDLRNPFQGFYKLTEYISREFDTLDMGELKTMIMDMSASSKKLNKLLENLLAWSRVQLGKITVKMEEHNLKQLIDVNITLFNDIAGSKNININNKVHHQFKVFTDIQMFNTVIRNIISNAIKFTDVFGEVSLSASRQNGSVLLSIEDNGIGMAPDELSQLFSIDTQAVKSGTAGEIGTGLGLILSKELLDRIDCSIAVKSRAGEGSTFILKIPAKKPKK